MNQIAILESSVDSIEPGSPVHDSVYNFVSAARKNYRNTDPAEILEYTSKVSSIVSGFARLPEEHQWGLEDEVAHTIDNVTRCI